MVVARAFKLGAPLTRARVKPPVSWPVALLLVAACAFLAVGSLHSPRFAEQVVIGLANGSVYASLAVALVLIYRATEVINFAQGEMAMFTTYIAYQLTKWGLSYWEAFACTVVIAFVGGIAIERTIVRRASRGGPLTVVVVTIGLLFLLQGAAEWIWSSQFALFPSAFSARQIHVGSVTFPLQDLGIIAVTIGAVILLWVFFQFTKTGLAMRASALRPAAARLVGVRVGWMLALGWGLAAVLGAIAGMMIAPTPTILLLSPTMMDPILIYAFAAAVVGGIESPAGAVVGALGIGVLLSLLETYVGFLHSAPELDLPVVLALLLVVLLIRPSGLFGRTVVHRV
jgi:branched-chain amino acid transport system permease protein